jgi:DNA-binding transcriptional MerR regulator
MSTPLRTGELAARAGVNIQTLRYYERRGLLAEPSRSHGGHRLYPADTVCRRSRNSPGVGSRNSPGGGPRV